MASHKQKVWLEEYFKCGFNAAEAARRAGYAHPTVAGTRNKKYFAGEIETRLEERAMSANEALALLADQARGRIDLVLDIDEADGQYFRIDLNKARDAGVLHLIKEVGYDSNNKPYVKIESTQSALDKILRAHGAYKDGIEHSGTIALEVDDAREAIQRKLNSIRANRDAADVSEESDG